MEAKAIQKDIRMPARKLRRVINVVRGKSVIEAIRILKFMPYFAARMVEKNLKVAVANAAEKSGMTAEQLKLFSYFKENPLNYRLLKICLV